MIILYCVKVGGKLRIKFHSFIDRENKVFKNVYNNNYNCTFPKDIREVGRYYKVPDADIRLANRQNSRPYYSVKRSNVIVMTEEEKAAFLNSPIKPTSISDIKVFDAEECVICLSGASAIVFVPCGHQCVCSLCNDTLKKTKYCCPVCREKIKEDIVT